MPQGLCAEANTPFRGCRSQVTLGGGARETIYLQPPPHKPRRHCLSPGRLLRKLRSRKVGCKLPVSSSGERNHAFLEQEEATAVSTRPLEGHQLFQEGLSFRVMTLSSDRAGEGPVEMAEHTSECTPDLLQVAEAELNPQISSPRGVTRRFWHLQECSKLRAEQGTHTVQAQHLQEAESSKGHETGSCSAAMAGCGATGSMHPPLWQPQALGHSQTAAACPSSSLLGGTALPAPSSCTLEPQQRRRKGGSRLAVWQSRLCAELGPRWQ